MVSARMALGGKEEGEGEGEGEDPKEGKATLRSVPGDLLLPPASARSPLPPNGVLRLEGKLKEVVEVCSGAADAGAAAASSIVVPLPGGVTNALIRGNALWRGIAEEALRRCGVDAEREGPDSRGDSSGDDLLSIFESRCIGLKCCRLRGDLRHLICQPVGDMVPPEVVVSGGGGGASGGDNELAVRFRFQLPSGSYATCALRQLLHSDLVMG
jgi:hypothetical protein